MLRILWNDPFSFSISEFLDHSESLKSDILTTESLEDADDASDDGSLQSVDEDKMDHILYGCATSKHSLYDAVLYMYCFR